jgi:hypothetical protein
MLSSIILPVITFGALLVHGTPIVVDIVERIVERNAPDDTGVCHVHHSSIHRRRSPESRSTSAAMSIGLFANICSANGAIQLPMPTVFNSTARPVLLDPILASNVSSTRQSILFRRALDSTFKLLD